MPDAKPAQQKPRIGLMNLTRQLSKAMENISTGKEVVYAYMHTCIYVYVYTYNYMCICNTSYLLRLLACLPVRLAPLLTLLLLTLRLRFLRRTGEGLDELTGATLAFTSSLPESLDPEAAGLALVFASFFGGLASLSESLPAGLLLLLFSGLLFTLPAGDLALAGCSFFLSLGPASSESESDAGLSALTVAAGSAFLTGLDFSPLVSVLSLVSLLLLPFSSAALLLEARSLLAALVRSERRSLLRLRGEEGEGLRRRRGELRLLSRRRESRCLKDIGLLARL